MLHEGSDKEQLIEEEEVESVVVAQVDQKTEEIPKGGKTKKGRRLGAKNKKKEPVKVNAEVKVNEEVRVNTNVKIEEEVKVEGEYSGRVTRSRKRMEGCFSESKNK